jgi:hypothetical protein
MEYFSLLVKIFYSRLPFYYNVYINYFFSFIGRKNFFFSFLLIIYPVCPDCRQAGDRQVSNTYKKPVAPY